MLESCQQLVWHAAGAQGGAAVRATRRVVARAPWVGLGLRLELG